MLTEKTQESLKAKIAELLLYSPKISKTYADTYIFEPSNEEEERFGKLFIVIEIEHQRRTAKEVADAIATIVQHEYYQADDLSVEEHFERAITKTNEILGDLAEQGETSWVSKIHAVIASLTDRQLSLTKTGDAVAYLFRANEAINITEHLYDDEPAPATDPAHNPLKTFVNVASGLVEEKDKILFATPELLTHLDPQTISSAILGSNPTLASTRLQTLLQTQKTQRAVGALITEINRQTVEEVIDKVGVPANPLPLSLDDIVSDDSHQELQETAEERATSTAYFKEILAQESLDEPSEQLIMASQDIHDRPVRPATTDVLGVVNEFLQKRWRMVRMAITHIRDPRYKSVLKRDLAARTQQEKSLSTPNSQRLTSLSPRASLAGTSRTQQILGSAQVIMRSIFTAAAKAVSAALTFLFDVFSRLSVRNRLVVGGVIAVVVAGALLGSHSFGSKQKKTSGQQLASLVSDAEKKFDDAQNALIYGDVTKASALLKEAQALQAQVGSNQELKDRSDALQKKVTDQLDIINKVARIATPAVKFQLSENGAVIKSNSLLSSTTSLYTFSTDQNKVYELNPAKSTVAALSTTSENIGHLTRGTFDAKGNQLLFATDTPGLAQFGLKSSASALTAGKITLPETTTSITDLNTYNGKLYLLDAAAGQITSYTPTTTGFSKGTPWTKDSATTSPLVHGLSMTIDGAIYVLTSDGTVVKYLRGIDQHFTLEQLSTPLEHPTSLFTSDAINELYILDAPNNRIVITDKNGKLIKQLISDSFAGATSIAVIKGKAGESLYVLSSETGTVFEIKSPAGV